MSLLQVHNLNTRYGDFQALHEVALTVGEGETLALVGANGAGKTTLLRTVAGGLAPSGGRVLFSGNDIGRLAPHERIRLGIALVPEGRRLFPSLTAEENILVGATQTYAPTWPLARIYDAFPLIARRRSHRAATLSGGEAQAVAIARAIACGPRLLLLDEISLGLAPAIIDDVYAILAHLRADGTALILVEQDLDRALAATDRVACLLEGRIVLTASSRSVARTDVVRAYFGETAAR